MQRRSATDRPGPPRARIYGGLSGPCWPGVAACLLCGSALRRRTSAGTSGRCSRRALAAAEGRAITPDRRLLPPPKRGGGDLFFHSGVSRHLRRRRGRSTGARSFWPCFGRHHCCRLGPPRTPAGHLDGRTTMVSARRPGCRTPTEPAQFSRGAAWRISVHIRPVSPIHRDAKNPSCLRDSSSAPQLYESSAFTFCRVLSSLRLPSQFYAKKIV